MQLILGDSLIELSKLPENSVDSIVTDPPYGLSFMGKKWDYDVPSVELWQEAMRVLKPGGHLLSFAGSRTYHRMAVNIEDAGFDIRDQIMWVYGSGFPKSHNIGKAVDKLQGNEREVIDKDKSGKKNIGTIGHKGGEYDLTKGTSEWEGWGTALKPAHEPIVVARKPFKGTVASNVLEHGTGGINIDGCRVGTGEDRTRGGTGGHKTQYVGGELEQKVDRATGGRFPANFIHDGSDEATVGLGGKARYFYTAKASKKDRNEGLEGFEVKQTVGGGGGIGDYLDDVNSASGKYGSEKAPHKNNHPTVKPTALMQYLVRLVTPPQGTVLDPFMGSGSTGKACKLEGFDFIGIELDPEYCKIAEARIDALD
jgi:site-specific DNA-methyltransferase (adenine-specific)